MRHGKAEQTDAVADRERKLTSRGKRDSTAMGRAVANAYRPDRILCSPSRRTRETLAAMLPEIGELADVTFLEALYDAPGDYIRVLTENGLSTPRLLLIGHNPAVQQSALSLIGSGDGALRGELHEKFPTSAVAVIDFDRAWRQLEPLSGRLLAFMTP